MDAKGYSDYVMTQWGRNRGTADVTVPKHTDLSVLSDAEAAEYVHDLETEVAQLKSRFISATGMGGELGEALEHLKKNVRDGKPVGNEFLLEMGDLLHYLTRNLGEHGYSLQDCIEANVAKLDARYGGRKPAHG